jgi:hypothetical protein
MGCDERRPDDDLAVLADAAREIRSAIDRLERLHQSGGERTQASRGAERELAQVYAACSTESRAPARAHLARLELILAESLARAADEARAVADALALHEEHCLPAAAAPGVSSRSAATVARRLSHAAADWRS